MRSLSHCMRQASTWTYRRRQSLWTSGRPRERSSIRRHRRFLEADGDKMKKIDIDQLRQADLVDLNHRIVERLSFLQQIRAHARMLEFSIGDRVCFQAGEHGLVEGMLTRYNKKTVTVIADDKRQWNVSPGNAIEF